MTRIVLSGNSNLTGSAVNMASIAQDSINKFQFQKFQGKKLKGGENWNTWKRKILTLLFASYAKKGIEKKLDDNDSANISDIFEFSDILPNFGLIKRNLECI